MWFLLLGNFIVQKGNFLDVRVLLIIISNIISIIKIILLYPFLSQVVGITLGQDGIPGFRTLFGLTIVTIATLLWSYGSKLKAITTVQKIWDNENIESKVQMSFLGSLRKISSEEIFANDSIEK